MTIIENMEKPGDPLNVTCGWCDDPSHFTALTNGQIRLYSCASHKRQLENGVEQLNKYKHLSNIR